MKFFDKGELSVLWIFYLEYFLASLLFFMPAFYIVYFDSLGFSFTQIGLLLAMMPIMIILFEIPTGAIADLYGRKFSVIFGYVMEGSCMLLLFFIHNYYAMLLLFALLGIASTFSSGSKDAWAVDLVRKRNKKLVHNFFNKMIIFISLGALFSGILGAFLVGKYGLSIIWPVTTLSFIVSITLLSFAKEERVNKKLKENLSFSDLAKQTKQTVSYGYKHHVLFLFISAMIVLAFVSCFDSMITWTSLLKDLGFPDAYFGYLWSGLSLLGMVSIFASSKLVKRGSEKGFIVLTLLISTGVLAFLLLPQTWASALIILSVSSLFLQIRGPASDIYFHRFIPSRLRATMGSVKSMLIAVAAIPATLIVGYLVDIIGAKWTILISMPLIIPVIWLFLKINERKESLGAKNKSLLKKG